MHVILYRSVRRPPAPPPRSLPASFYRSPDASRFYRYPRSVLVPRGALADLAEPALDTPRPKPTPAATPFPAPDGLCGLPLRRDEGLVWSEGISAISCRRFCGEVVRGVRCAVCEVRGVKRVRNEEPNIRMQALPCVADLGLTDSLTH